MDSWRDFVPQGSGFFLSQDDQDDSSWFWAYHPDVWSQIRMMPVFGERIFVLTPFFFIFHPGIILLYLEENLPIILSPSCQDEDEDSLCFWVYHPAPF